jgi:phosphoenolpyruvate carboxylase
VRAEIAETIASAARQAYRSLAHEEPDFIPYFREATPIDVIERLEIGSRPPSRREQKGVGDLRAIPWVFAWTQSRLVLPGWYGVGTGLARARDAFGIEPLQQLSNEWRFLATLLGDVEMVLAKADLEIAARYAQLAGDVGVRLFPRLREEFLRTEEMILTIRDSSDLLLGDPVLRRAIRLRNPYVDPMSFAQVDLLARWRQGGRRDEDLLQALFRTVRGISRGLQNTG